MEDEARAIKEFELKGKADEALAAAGAYRLRSVTSDRKQKPDYDIETGTTRFNLVSLDVGACLYWTETAAADASGAKCLVRCVRYDPDTDTAYGPFSLAELPDNTGSVHLLDSSTGYYSVDTKNSGGSYLRQSFFRFTYGPVASAEMTAAVLSYPCVSTGNSADLVLSVRNAGNVPLAALDVTIMDTQTNAPVQTLHIDLSNPDLSTNRYSFHGADHTITGANALRWISSMVDPLNHDIWTITNTTSAGSTVRSCASSSSPQASPPPRDRRPCSP